MFDAELADAPTETLEYVYAQLDALENAVRSQKLRMLGLLDERDAGRENGATDTATGLR